MGMKDPAFLCMGIVMAALLTGCGFSGQGRKMGEEVTKEIFAMDTYMTVTVYGENAEEAAEAAVKEINRLEGLLSTEEEGSEVAALNVNGTGYLSEDTAFLWESSYEIYEATDGAFDITVYPLMKAWGFAGGDFHVPGKDTLEELLGRVDSSRIKWDAAQKRMDLPEGVQIDFGGIAKGYTGARLAELLKERGVKSAMLNLGGNIQLLGSKPDGSSFRIAIKCPDGSSPYLGVLSVRDTAVVTSGGYERNFEENGVLYHHIIDPATGYPAESGLQSVTIVCGDGTAADGYSTALYIMGKEKAVLFWREHAEEFDAVFLTKEGELLITEGLQGQFSSDLSYEIITK